MLYWVPGAGHRSQAFWYGMVAHILFPQRTVQHAYPLALSALLVLWVAGTALALGGSQAPLVDASAPVPPIAPLKDAGDASDASAADDVARGSAKRRKNKGLGGGAGAPPRDGAREDDASKAARAYFAPPLPLPALRERLALFALGGVLTGLLPLMQVREGEREGAEALPRHELSPRPPCSRTPSSPSASSPSSLRPVSLPSASSARPSASAARRSPARASSSPSGRSMAPSRSASRGRSSRSTSCTALAPSASLAARRASSAS